MSNFNIKRFGRMALWTFRMEGKGLLACLGGITFGFLVCGIAYLWPLLKSGIEIAGSSSEELAGNFRGKNLMIIYPDQYGEAANVMTYAAPQMHEERSAYTALREWLGRKMKARGRQDA